MAKRIYLVTGARDWGWIERPSAPPLYSLKHEKRMRQVFGKMVPGSIVLQGGARGADVMAASLTADYGLFSLTMPYARFLGKGGGPARNRKMLAILIGLREAGWSARVLAFHDDLGESKGTVDMLKTSLAEGFTATLISVISAQTLRSSRDLRKIL